MIQQSGARWNRFRFVHNGLCLHRMYLWRRCIIRRTEEIFLNQREAAKISQCFHKRYACHTEVTDGTLGNGARQLPQFHLFNKTNAKYNIVKTNATANLPKQQQIDGGGNNVRQRVEANFVRVNFNDKTDWGLSLKIAFLGMRTDTRNRSPSQAVSVPVHRSRLPSNQRGTSVRKI